MNWTMILAVIAGTSASATFLWWLYKLVLGVGARRERIDGTVAVVREIPGKLDAMDGKLDRIVSHFDSAAVALERKSPVALNEFGEKIAEMIDAQALAEKYKGKVQISDGSTAYDIQKECFAFARGNKAKDEKFDEADLEIDVEDLKVMKNSAFEQSTELEVVLAVLGVAIRDAILKERNLGNL